MGTRQTPERRGDADVGASAENIGFAIAIDQAVPVIEGLAGTTL